MGKGKVCVCVLAVRVYSLNNTRNKQRHHKKKKKEEEEDDCNRRGAGVIAVQGVQYDEGTQEEDII